jgi:hypothetical protein
MGKTLFNEKLGIEVESSECKIQIYTRQRSEQTISTQLLTLATQLWGDRNSNGAKP